MSKKSVIFEKQSDGIGIIKFNRPNAMNALTLDMMKDFSQRIHDLSFDEGLRVVIVTGMGEQAFCSGGDLRELSHYPSAEDAQKMIALMGDALLKLEQLSVPVIAAINGYALGGGSEISLACDLRIVDENVRFGLVQINMALTPGWGAGQRLLRLVGYSKAMELLLKGEPMGASEVLELGLANTIVEAGKAFEYSLDFAIRIASRPPNVIRGIKNLLQAGLNQSYGRALKTEQAIFPPLWEADAHNQAVRDFIARQDSRKL